MFATSALVLLLPFLSLLAPTHVAGHGMVISIHGSNHVEGRGFGVSLGRPRHNGEKGDSGADASQFIDADMNSGAVSQCGRTPLNGNNVIGPSLNQAEGLGLPAAFPNRSVSFDYFQVNADGGGPCFAEVSSTATGTDFKPIPINLNLPGTEGIFPQTNTNVSMVLTLPSDAKCTGGETGKACIVRLRCGRFKKFGSCFAVQLAGASAATPPDAVAAAIKSAFKGTGISNGRLRTASKKVAATLIKQGYLLSAPVPSKSKRDVDGHDEISDAKLVRRHMSFKMGAKRLTRELDAGLFGEGQMMEI